jgi:hypothetical protein
MQGLAGHVSGVLLVAQANGLADDTTADGADFLRNLCKAPTLARQGLDRFRSRLLDYLVYERFG